MRHLLTALFLLAASYSQTSFANSFDHQHQAFTDILSNYVVVTSNQQQSSVNYAALAENRTELDAYLASLSAVSKAEYSSWTSDQQLAFLINAYNGFTLQLIVDHYDEFAAGDATSIRDLGELFSTPWRLEFFTLLEEQRHLDWVEHSTIRRDFDEPRIHAALVCAAVSCPKLREEAFTGAQLAAELEEQMQLFLADRSKNGIDEKGLYLSKIFDWYADDFGHVPTYLKQYQEAVADTPTDKHELQSGTLKVRYTEYDWTLNTSE